jgi:arylsulfatase A-like enzyme
MTLKLSRLQERIPSTSSLGFRHFVFLLSIAFGISACGNESPLPQEGRPPGKLNIVFVLSDALRAANMPMYGYPRNTTPSLQKIARSGIFDNHLANAPSTIISVSQLFSGRLMSPILLGAQHRVVMTKAIPEDLLLLPEVLKENGYRTAIVTAHSWFNTQARILEHFDIQKTPAPKSKAPYPEFEQLLPDIRQFITEASDRDEPFFLYIHAMDTHSPFRFHQGFDQYRNAEDWPPDYNVYDSEIAYSDHWIQQIHNALQESGALSRTIFVFTSDHGEEFNEIGPGWPNRTHGYSARRALHHIPLIICLPGEPNPGRSYPGRTQHLDLAPTLARLAVPDIDLDAYQFDGRDLSSELYGGASAKAIEETISRGSRFWGFYQQNREIHYDHWKEKFLAYDIQTDRFNYPRPVLGKEPRPRAEQENAMRSVFQRSKEEFEQLPHNQDLLGRVNLNVSPFIVSASTVGIPTYAEDEDDGQWHLRPWTSLSAGPTEKPGTITMAVPWAAERFRVWVRLDEKAIQKGYRNGFLVKISGKEERLISIEQAGMERGALVDLGEHDLDGQFEVSISKPEGGVAISGFTLVYLGEELPRNPQPTTGTSMSDCGLSATWNSATATC